MEIDSDPIVSNVINKYLERSKEGMKKYGMTLEENPGKILYWLKNFQEELQDATLYIERIMQELNNNAKK